MRAGALRHSITIQQKSATGSPAQNEFGEPEETWADFATEVPAEKDPRSGREAFITQQRQDEHLTVWRIRYMDGVTQGMRIVHLGVIYDIKSVLDIGGRGIKLDIACESGSAIRG